MILVTDRLDGKSTAVDQSYDQMTPATLLSLVSVGDAGAIAFLNGKKSSSYDESQHPRDDHGRWTDSGSTASAPVTRGLVADAETDEVTAQRFADHKATAGDVLGLIDTRDVGAYWWPGEDTADAKEYAYAQPDVGAQSAIDQMQPPDGRESAVFQVGVVLSGKVDPAALDTSTAAHQAEDRVRNPTGLMGNSFLPGGTAIHLTAVHYDPGDGQWTTVPVDRAVTLPELAKSGDALRTLIEIERLKYDPNEPRDDHGRWTSDGSPSDMHTEPTVGTSARPEFEHSHAAPVSKLSVGKLGYIHAHGLPDPVAKDWQSITADPKLQEKWARDFMAMNNGDSPETRAAYDQFAKENAAQYEYLTKTLGVQVEVLDHDPYRNVDEMIADVRDHNHLGVLSTAATGSHQYLTDEQNDQFRAVHDAFGHAAIGRGFDRNGEEAAYQSHAQMFSPEALKALASETRGQNAVLITTGSFPDQRIGVLPPEDLKKLRNPDDDNNYAVTRCHHTSCGRTLANKSKALDAWAASRKTSYVERPVVEASDEDWSEVDAWLARSDEMKSLDVLRSLHEAQHPGEPFRYHRWKFDENEPRDDHGRWTSGGGGDTTVHSDGRFLGRDTEFGVVGPVPEITQYALDKAQKLEGPNGNAVAKDGGENGLYAHAEEYANYADVKSENVDGNGNYIPPTEWEPGTLDAQSQAATAWQTSFFRSEGMQVAADALLGYGNLPINMNDQIKPNDAAYAREMLTMMSGNVAEGAATGNAITVEGDQYLRNEDFTKGTLARGVSDPTGALTETFQHSLDSGEPVAWSMASFVVGDGLGEERIKWQQDELGEDPPTFENPDTGEERTMNGSQNAAATALSYTVPSESHFGGGPEDSVAPVLILGEGRALVVDGSFEAVMGGKFKVTDVHTATDMERMVWNADKSIGGQPLTVVRIKQVENVKLPPGVATI